MKREMKYELKAPFEYSKSGDFVEAKTITVAAPTNRVLKYVSFIEQEFEKSQIQTLANVKSALGEQAFAAILENRKFSDKGDPDQDQKIDGETVVKNLMSSGCDIEKCFDHLKQILISGKVEKPNCVIDDIERMTEVIFEDMSTIDTKNLLGEYIINFITASQDS